MRDRPVCVAKATSERTVPNKSEGRVDAILKVWDRCRDLDETCRKTCPSTLLSEAESEALTPASEIANREALNFSEGDCPSIADRMTASYKRWREYVSSVVIAHNRTM